MLVDSEWLASRVEAELLRELGLKLASRKFTSCSSERPLRACSNIVAARSGPRPRAEFTYNWAFATAHAFMRELKPIPYVRAAIEELRGRGAPLAVASQSPLARVRLSLEVTGLAAILRRARLRHLMVPRPKPAPDIYLLAAARLGAAPGDCVVVEDSPAGAAAARGAGMHAIGYAPGATADAMRANGIAVHALHGRAPGRIAALH